MGDKPRVSVLIPTRQRMDSLRRALDSLGAQTAAGEFEVVVGVDGSTDGTLEMLEAYEAPFGLSWTRSPKRGRAATCNAALAVASGEVLIVLDDDMQVVGDFVERHSRHHPPGSRVCVLGAVPVEIGPSSTPVAAYVKRKFDLHLSRLRDPDHLNLTRSFYTGNASLRAEVLGEVGCFDESFGVYGNEDVELALRLRAAGVTLAFDPDAVARQEYGKDLRGLQRDTFEKGRTTVLLARTHPEVFGELRLAEPRESSRPWLSLRSVLLWATTRMPATMSAVFAVAAFLERVGLRRQPLFYRAALDYAFWAGVRTELRESNDDGELALLAGELRRGPIDLLLHG